MIAKNHESYDFSSQEGWNDFYNNHNGDIQESSYHDTPSNNNNHASLEYEWHASMSNNVIVNEILKQTQLQEQSSHGSLSSSCLFIGCGNSALPRRLYDASRGKILVTCLDYSKPCLDIIQKLHSNDCPNMRFVHGDVMQLSTIFPANYDNDDSISRENKFTSIVDKGLLDALMCAEDWSSTVTKLMKQIFEVLDNENGIYILISYKLASSTKKFLTDASLGILDWTFDIEEKSNERVSFSIAKFKAKR